MTRRTRVLALLLALLLGMWGGVATLEGRQPFSAQIQQALQILGLYPYGTYATGDVPTWNNTTQQFAPSSGSGVVISASSFQAAATPANCSTAQYGFVGDTNTGLGYNATDVPAICTGGSTTATFGVSGSSYYIALGADAFLWRDGSGHVLGQRSGLQAQRWNVYNTYTSATNNELFSVDWQTTANLALVGARTATTGNSRRAMFLSQNDNANNLYAAVSVFANADPRIRAGLYNAGGVVTSVSANGTLVQLGEWTNTVTSGSTVAVSVVPTYNQAAATTANTDFLINRTQTSVGSGTQLLIDAQVGGTSQFSVNNAGSVALVNSGNYRWTGRTLLTSSGDGLFNIISSGGTVGIQLNEGTAAPTISSGGGTSPAIVAGARNAAGSVNIGTGGTASQIVIAFGNPAWTNAPYCNAWVETATAGNTRAHGVTTTTTTMTIQAASAWAASSIVAWQCIGRI